jgi:hypothetical protein
MDWLRLYKKLRAFATEQGFVSDKADTYLMAAAKAIAEDPRSNTDDFQEQQADCDQVLSKYVDH